MAGKLITKIMYHDHTIFVYQNPGGGRYYMLTAGLSSHKYKTLVTARAAIDKGTHRSKSRRKR